MSTGALLRTGGGGIQGSNSELGNYLLPCPVVTDGAADACMAANEILQLLQTIPQWPQGYQDHFERVLKGSPDGWKRMARDLVSHHSQQGADRKMAGATLELQREVLELLFKSEFERVAMSQFGEGTAAPAGGGDPWDALPEYMRKGPWSPLSYPSYIAYAAALVWQAKPALREWHVLHEAAQATHDALVKATEEGDAWVRQLLNHLAAAHFCGFNIKASKKDRSRLRLWFTPAVGKRLEAEREN